jgi:hypothetical protein
MACLTPSQKRYEVRYNKSPSGPPPYHCLNILELSIRTFGVVQSGEQHFCRRIENVKEDVKTKALGFSQATASKVVSFHFVV